jgi:hypothetical protein
MGKIKIKYIGWFFGFIWNCIRDLVTEPIGFFKYGIAKENWEDYKTRIDFDTDPELKQKLAEFATFDFSYSSKPVDKSLYQNITISNVTSEDFDKLEPRLTEAEFRAGKQGYVWLDHKTGKLVFREDERANQK